MSIDSSSNLLAKCCSLQRPATIISLQTGESLCGRFLELRGDALALEVFPEAQLGKGLGKEFRRLSIHVVAFSLDTKTHIGIFTVHDYTDQISPPRLVLRLQSPIASAERRAAFRVPLRYNSGLTVLATKGEGEWSPRPVNISLAGILIEFEKNHVPDLSIDSELQIELRLADLVANFNAIVRRREGQRYGLMFPEALGADGIETSDSHRAIVNLLERDWLQQRVKTREKKNP